VFTQKLSKSKHKSSPKFPKRKNGGCDRLLVWVSEVLLWDIVLSSFRISFKICLSAIFLSLKSLEIILNLRKLWFIIVGKVFQQN